MTVLGPDDDVLCTGTLGDAPFVEKVEAAAEAGFRAISLRPLEYQRARDGGLSDADVRAVLRTHAVAVAELDPVLSWIPEPIAANRHAFALDEIFRIAAVVEPHCLSVLVDMSYSGTIDALIDPFTELCRAAGARGLECGVEFFAFSPLRTLTDTWRLVTASNQPNAKIIFDNWHHLRVGGTDADLAIIDARRIVGIQLSDAPRWPAFAALPRECMADRRWPGEADAGVGRTLAALRRHGCRAPVGIEVFGTGDTRERALRARRALAHVRG